MKIPEDIFAAAKQTVCQLGHFQPTVFVYGTNSKVYMPLPFGKTTDERVAIMTQAGIQLAKDNQLGEVERVIFVCEGWASPPRQPFIAPSQDPNRQEVLLFNSLDAKTNAQALDIYTCVRNRAQAVIDLQVMKQPGDATIESRLLPFFMAGFRLFKR